MAAANPTFDLTKLNLQFPFNVKREHLNWIIFINWRTTIVRVRWKNE